MKNQKLFIMIVALIVVAVGAYLYFSKSSSQTDTPAKATTNTLVSTTTGDSPVALGENNAASFAGSDIAALLKNVDQIKLNTSILNNPAFLSLVDTTLTLPVTDVSGRINPFGKSGALDSASPAASQINSTDTTAQTVTPVTTNTNSLPKK